jgi:hypothetical protein
VKHSIKLVLSHLLGIDTTGRDLIVRPDDTFLTSYPRSGNTWTRFLLANLMHPDQEVSFTNIDNLIPEVGVTSSRRLKRVSAPRLIKSHEYFDPRYPQVIYIVRDPRDVAVSLYNFRRKWHAIDDTYPIERWVSERFLSGERVSWGEHVGSWLATRMNHPGFLLVRYEDLRQETVRELRRIADLLGASTNPDNLRQAIEKSDSQRMRELEKREHEEWRGTRGNRTDIPFVGTAIAGGWKQRLPESSAALIESKWGHLMNTLGYESSVAPSTRACVITF